EASKPQTSAVSMIVCAVLSSVFTYLITAYQLDEGQENWLAQQDYLAQQKRHEEKLRLKDSLMTIFIEQRSLQGRMAALSFQNATLLNHPTLPIELIHRQYDDLEQQISTDTQEL